MYDLIEYNNNYSKTSRRLWQYCRNKSDNNIPYSKSFEYKSRFTSKTSDVGIVNIEIAVSLKYQNTFWRTLGMQLIDCEINLILTWSSSCVIWKADSEKAFSRTDTKLCVPAVTLSTQDNAKLPEPLKSGFKQTIKDTLNAYFC